MLGRNPAQDAPMPNRQPLATFHANTEFQLNKREGWRLFPQNRGVSNKRSEHNNEQLTPNIVLQQQINSPYQTQAQTRRIASSPLRLPWQIGSAA